MSCEKALKLDRLMNDFCYVNDGVILGAWFGDVSGLGAKWKIILTAELAMGLAQTRTFGIVTMVAAQDRAYVGCFRGGDKGGHGEGARDCRG